MKKEIKEGMKRNKTMEEKLNKIFDELQKEAYNAEYHAYDYKSANQIIRKHFEKIASQLEPLVIPKIEEVKDKIADEVGFSINEGGGCDNGNREYGISDDGLIELVYNIMSNFCITDQA